MPGAPAIPSALTNLRTNARIIVRMAALGLGAGAVAGALIGGIGGRLAMLVLRRESPGARGLTSDAGFEIGRVTVGGTLGLLVLTALLGAVGGLAYVAVRGGVPAPARIPAAALVGATAGGSAFLEPDGIDLLVLGPLWFAVTAFIALPALTAAAAAVIVERRTRGAKTATSSTWTTRPAWAGLTARIAICGVVLAFIVVQGAELIDDVTAIL